MLLATLLAFSTSTLTPNTNVTDYKTNLFDHKKYTCFTRHNELRVNIDSGELCIELEPTGDEACRILPKGVYFDVYVSFYQTEFIRFLVEEYSYARTSYCAQCFDSTCAFIQDTTSAMAYLRTYTREVEIKIGRIIVEHTDLAECYDTMESFYWKYQNSGVFKLTSLGKCAIDMAKCTELTVIFTLKEETVWQESFLPSEFTFVEDMLSFPPMHEFTIVRDWQTENQEIYDRVEILLHFEDGSVEYIIKGYISIFLSGSIKELMFAPTAIIRPGEIEITHEPLANADQIEAALGSVDKVTIQIAIRNATNSTIIGLVNFEREVWDFRKYGDKTYICENALNSESCTTVVEHLLGQSLNGINLDVFVTFWRASQQIEMGSEIISRIFDSCWQNTRADFEEQKLCFLLTPSGSEECPFLQRTNASIDLLFGKTDQKFTFKRLYEVDNSEICFPCVEFEGITLSECDKLLQRMFKERSSMMLTFSSKSDVEEIEVVEMFNNDYRFMYQTVGYFAAAAIPVVIIMCVFTVLCKGSYIKCKPKRKVVKELDEIQ